MKSYKETMEFCYKEVKGDTEYEKAQATLKLAKETRIAGQLISTLEATADKKDKRKKCQPKLKEVEQLSLSLPKALLERAEKAVMMRLS